VATPEFNYDQAFSRNIGWVTRAEQQALRAKRVAIAGLGGVGGSHLLTRSPDWASDRSPSDFDTFDLPNFNSPAGAMMSSVGGRRPMSVMSMALDINPELKIAVFRGRGSADDNVDAFRRGVDLCVDRLDSSLSQREGVFVACARRRCRPSQWPLGMGAALLNFLPGPDDLRGILPC
jgi:tRNA A37 threonylcarbamoyladenosine dehydratase